MKSSINVTRFAIVSSKSCGSNDQFTIARAKENSNFSFRDFALEEIYVSWGKSNALLGWGN